MQSEGGERFLVALLLLVLLVALSSALLHLTSISFFFSLSTNGNHHRSVYNVGESGAVAFAEALQKNSSLIFLE